jgi:hypothetical protein
MTLLAALGAFVLNLHLNAAGRPGVTFIRFLSSPVPRGGQIKIQVLAPPQAVCKLTMTNSVGALLGLPDAAPLATDANGRATRTWRIDPGLAPGTYRVIVSCSPGTVSTTTFTVS